MFFRVYINFYIIFYTTYILIDLILPFDESISRIIGINIVSVVITIYHLAKKEKEIF